MPDQQQDLVRDEGAPAFDRRERIPAATLKRHQRPCAGTAPCLSRGTLQQQIAVTA